jgi:hypothetical protein
LQAKSLAEAERRATAATEAAQRNAAAAEEARAALGRCEQELEEKVRGGAVWLHQVYLTTITTSSLTEGAVAQGRKDDVQGMRPLLPYLPEW